MVRKHDIEFIEADAPITEPVTKFGGQPVWIREPEWPLSRKRGEQMEFICQVTLDLLGGMPDGIAYVFMTGDYEEGMFDYVRTWAPDAGENAVVVQAAGRNDSAPSAGLSTRPLETGPSVRKWNEGDSNGGSGWVPCEFAAILAPSEDSDFVDEGEMLRSWDEEAREARFVALEGNKIGGTPIFIQSDEFPEGGPWRLLLQLDSMAVPFHVNFGDAGMGYAYISEDGKSGRFLWQCY